VTISFLRQNRLKTPVTKKKTFSKHKNSGGATPPTHQRYRIYVV
jgi:hypothetical protein